MKGGDRRFETFESTAEFWANARKRAKQLGIHPNWPTDGRPTPGPFTPTEHGPVVGDVVLKPGDRVYCGGAQPKLISHPMRFSPPVDKAEVGSRY